MKNERIIKTYESFNLRDTKLGKFVKKYIKSKTDLALEKIDLGRFEERIDKSKLLLNDDGTFDYKSFDQFSSLNFSGLGIRSLLEIPIRFRNVGYFNCSNNHLINLIGSPVCVYELLDCSNNNLLSFRGNIKEIRNGIFKYNGGLECNGNNLISKIGIPYSNITTVLGYKFDNDAFTINDKLIKTLKEMTVEEKMEELKFFEENDKNAYQMMLKAMNDNDIGYGQKSKEMEGIVKGNDNLNTFF